MFGNVVSRLGTLGQLDDHILRCAVDGLVQRDRSQFRADLDAKQLDLRLVRLVAGPKALDLQANAVLKADKATAAPSESASGWL